MGLKSYQTDQENFWAGDFGRGYIDRNKGNVDLASKTAMFAQIFEHLDAPIETAIEFGPNIGLNIIAMKRLLPELRCRGVEINESAVEQLSKLPDTEGVCSSILSYEADRTYALSLICGVLIHINPEFLPNVYEKLYKSSRAYICIAEYYNPTPVEVDYRGNKDRLFKRDFAGEFLQSYPDVKLVQSGFRYHNHPVFPSDDITWFLLKKTGE